MFLFIKDIQLDQLQLASAAKLKGVSASDILKVEDWLFYCRPIENVGVRINLVS